MSSTEGKLRLWRDTSLASLPDGDKATLAAHTIGYESNEDVDNGSRPAGLVRLSTTTGPTPEYLTDFGGRSSVVAGTTTHHLTMYKAASGALVFSAGTIQWAWGLDSNHDGRNVPAADQRMRQATANILADMGATPTTLASGLVMPSASTDTTAPTSTITQPAAGNVDAGDVVTVKGTAADVDGRVAGVEVSVDGGDLPPRGRHHELQLHRGRGRQWPGSDPGPCDRRLRQHAGADEARCHGNLPVLDLRRSATQDRKRRRQLSLTLGTRFTASADGFITGIRFFKSSANTGTHVGTLFSSSGEALATATFTNETASGWQSVNFASAVPIVKGQTYVAAYKAPNGHYAADPYFFSYGGTAPVV